MNLEQALNDYRADQFNLYSFPICSELHSLSISQIQMLTNIFFYATNNLLNKHL
jgi:hypothetical protein